MLLHIIFWYLIVSCISAFILFLLGRNAPSGWEDENGFHEKRKDK
jgi:hypothetical protein